MDLSLLPVPSSSRSTRPASVTIKQGSSAHLGPVAPISVNFNHQLAYFADQSDTTHVRHQPTAVA